MIDTVKKSNRESLVVSNNILNQDYEFNEHAGKLIVASQIVDSTFDYFNIERILNDNGRNPWDLKNMIKLMHLASVEKIESSIAISNKAKYDLLYGSLCGGITPSARSIRDYRRIYNAIKQLTLSFTLIVAGKLEITSFQHLSADGTIMIACNSPFNTINRKDIHLLIKHFMVEELTKKEIKQLRKPAKKFMNNKNLSYDDKINMLFDWLDKLDLTGQKSLPLFDVDARWMKIKDKGQKYKKLAYNIQICTDTYFKMICGINVVQYPTDHYQIPALLDQTMKNIQRKPEIVSADTIYGTISNIFYLKQHGISARIPSREQCNMSEDDSEDNPYAKKCFVFDEVHDVYTCPGKQILTKDGDYAAPPEKGGFNKRQIVYSNYAACQKCKNKSKCTKAKHRTITRYVHELCYEVEKIMDTKDGQEDYKQRSRTVEAHNGTFRRIYHFDSLYVRGIENVQGLMFGIAAAYNSIRLFNITRKKGWTVKKTVEFIQVVGLRKI